MPRDTLASLQRLEAALRAQLARKTGGRPGRRLLVLGAVLLLMLGAYAGTARWLLSGPRLRALINADPDSLLLDYDEATSWWPGRVTIRNLRIRGSDQNVQWIVQPGDRAARLLDPRPRAAHVSRGASSRGRPDLLPAQQAGARRRGERGRVRPAAGPGLPRSAAAVRPGPGPRARRQPLAHRRPQALHRPLRRHLGRRISLPRLCAPGGRLLSAPGTTRPHRTRARALRERPTARRKCAGRDLRRRHRVGSIPAVRAAPRPRQRGLAESHGRRLVRRRVRAARLSPVPRGSALRGPPGRRPGERNRFAAPSSTGSRRGKSGSASRPARSASAS